MRPVLKAILKPLIRHGDMLRVGFEKEIYEIEDADGKIERFLSGLDGGSSLEEVAARHEMTLPELQSILETFDELGFLDDAQALDSLRERDRERYRANLTYYSNFSTLHHSPAEFQQRVMNSTVAVLGLGGASLIAAGLAGLGVQKVIGLDFDSVELSNLNRQFLYHEGDIGTLKTEAAAVRLRELNRDVITVTHNQRVDSAAELIPLLRGVDLVINMIDTPSILALRWVNAACVELGVPYLIGGVGNNRLRVHRFIPHVHGCYDCYLIHLLRQDPHGAVDLSALYGKAFENRNTAMAHHVALLSGFLISETAKHVAGFAEPMPPSSSLQMDLVSMQFTQSDPFPRFDECPTCGNQGRGRADIEPVDLEKLTAVALEGSVPR